jgi:hypothetical protein
MGIVVVKVGAAQIIRIIGTVTDQAHCKYFIVGVLGRDSIRD